ncbi:MAG: hypothetical protein GEU78_06415 [Actinobacteria bacterium]|nr:hypothetical protein [Actinomycetota bacterium]
MKRWLQASVACGTAVLLLAGAALAHDPGDNRLEDDGAMNSGKETHAAHQHGGEDGHLPPVSNNVDLIGKAKASGVKPGRIADVGVFGNYAYLGAFWEPDCRRGGVYVFDISNPAAPKEVGFINTGNGSYVGEGVHIIHVDTPSFTGDVLAFNNEVCVDRANGATVGGLTLVDVTDPTRPRYLTQGFGDFTPTGINGPGVAHEIHSTFIWDAGDKAYAVMVDNEEGADVDIVDITDPRSPELIAEHDLNTKFPQIVQSDLGTAESFLHDMIVKKIGKKWIMLLSYWDGGYVVLDVTDPTKPKYKADSDFPNPDSLGLERGLNVPPEGNAHQSEFSLNNTHIVAADEDFTPFPTEILNVTDNTKFQSTSGTGTPPLKEGETIEGQARYVGLACPGDNVPAGDGTQIAVVERGVCFFSEKIATVEAAGGYDAIVVFNSERPDGCSDLLTMLAEGNTPSFFVGRDTAYAMFDLPYDDEACRAGTGTAPLEIGQTGDTLRFRSYFDGWGYVRLFSNNEGKLTELDQYAIPEAHDPEFAKGFGDLSVHEVAMSERDNSLAYFAYYSGGFRVARIENDELVEKGGFIDEGGNNFWGAQVFQRGAKEYVAASDRDFGLYIFEYTGP